MKYTQAITPNPNIPCKPGWCLAYVNEAFGVKKRFGSATAAWFGSNTVHMDYDFPADLWVPLWFHLENEPNGHVALRAPDGTVYSTTHPTRTTPTRHPDLADLIHAYSFYNPLTYLGWTEDVEGTRVLTPAPETTTLIEDDTMKIIARQNGTDEVYIGDFVTRRHVPDVATLEDLQWAATNNFGPKIFDNGNIQNVDRIEFIGKLV